MEALLLYGSDEEEGGSASASAPPAAPPSGVGSSSSSTSTSTDTRMVLGSVEAAPSVELAVYNKKEQRFTGQYDRQITTHNPKYEELFAEASGPVAPYNSVAHAARRNVLSGFAEDFDMHDFIFDEAYRQYTGRKASTMDPTGQRIVQRKDRSAEGSSSGVMERLVGSGGGEGSSSGVGAENHASRKQRKKRRAESWGNAEDESFRGPWASFEDSMVHVPEPEALTEDQQEEIEKLKRRRTEGKTGDEFETSAVCHLKNPYDSFGRSFLEPSRDLRLTFPTRCYLPRKFVHTWTGHTKGVNAIRFFPVTAHLLLSASMDGRVKLWNVHGNRNVVMTYMGHPKPVRDICFSNDGRHFLSASYDRTIKYWDTETGDVIGKFSSGKLPYCVKFNPDEDKQNEFVAGYSDKRLLQWDVRTKEEVCVYDRHLGAVNSITFMDRNRKFVSTSDDKTIRVWEYGINIEFRYVSEPWMHSMPVVATHPNGNWLAFQSFDNQILIYAAKEKFRLHKKKRFMGHIIAGYACQVAFSNDGKYIMSGDSEGRIWFWDWDTTKRVKTLKCHDGVCIGCDWHPYETSRVVSCGWDGTIKYWD